MWSFLVFTGTILCFYFLKKKKALEPVKLSYLDSALNRFQTFQTKENKNENIELDLYTNNSQFRQENIWKQRILMESTPRGNVYMYYDLYKHAFAYYSDAQIPYPILNACAMKYVRTYLCYDYFVDSSLIANNPFNQMREDEERKEKEEIASKKKEKGLVFDSSVFVKGKVITAKTIKIEHRNNFRYAGRYSSLNILQPYNKTRSTSYKEFKISFLLR